MPDDLTPTGQWLPIETAPRDGEEIIAYYGPNFDPVIDIISWEDDERYQEGWWTTGDYWKLELGRTVSLHSNWSHWMPLPDPPA